VTRVAVVQAQRVSRAARRGAADAARKNPVAAGAAARSPRRTHAQRREQAEQRLLEAALAIVAERGSIRMTLAEIGEAAGYSRGLPAHRFGSKAGLLRSLVAYIGERFKAEREAWPKRAPGLDAIRGTISIYFSRKGPGWTTTRALLVMMTEGFMASSALRSDIAEYNRAALDYFEKHIRYGVAHGEIAADTDPATSAVILLGAMRGAMMQWLVDERISLPKVRDRLLAVADVVLGAR
jgi:AcrR family transcriptional regulator